MLFARFTAARKKLTPCVRSTRSFSRVPGARVARLWLRTQVILCTNLHIIRLSLQRRYQGPRPGPSAAISEIGDYPTVGTVSAPSPAGALTSQGGQPPSTRWAAPLPRLAEWCPIVTVHASLPCSTCPHALSLTVTKHIPRCRPRPICACPWPWPPCPSPWSPSWSSRPICSCPSPSPSRLPPAWPSRSAPCQAQSHRCSGTSG